MLDRRITLTLLLLSCGGKENDSQAPQTSFDEACAVRDPNGMLLWGDLHAHSQYSFDAGAYGSILTTKDAFAYARGETVMLPDATGAPTRPATIDRPLDFLGMTEHGEFWARSRSALSQSGRATRPIPAPSGGTSSSPTAPTTLGC